VTAKVLDTVYMIVMPDAIGIVYGPPATSARDAWARVEELELMGSGVTAHELRRRGYRARRVQIMLEEA